MNLPAIGVEKCPCSENCKTYSLTGVGRFYQGSGFDKDVAEEVAKRCNAHDDLVAALRELWQYVLDSLGDDCGCAGGGYPDHPGAEYADPCATCKTKAALAKAGEK